MDADDFEDSRKGRYVGFSLLVSNYVAERRGAFSRAW